MENSGLLIGFRGQSSSSGLVASPSSAFCGLWFQSQCSFQRAVWDSGGGPPCGAVLSACGMLFRVRSMHVQLGDGHRSSYVVLGSLSWTSFSSWESFLPLAIRLQVFWLTATTLVSLVMHVLQLCLVQDQVLRGQTEKKTRDFSHTFGSMAPLAREKDFFSSEF